MTIDQIKTAADTNIRQKIAVNSVTRDEIADLIDNLADEQRDRGLYGVDTTAGLAAVSGANYRKVAVGDTGIFEWSSTGTANGTTIFAASGGGVWILKMTIPKGALASLNSIDYTTNLLTNKPTLGSLAALSSIDYASGQVINKPDLSLKADLVGGKVPSAQLPSYVDDVLEYANLAALPGTGEAGKIYITLDNNSTYRWSGSQYVLLVSGGGGGGGGSQSLDSVLGVGNVTDTTIIFDKTEPLPQNSDFIDAFILNPIQNHISQIPFKFTRWSIEQTGGIDYINVPHNEGVIFGFNLNGGGGKIVNNLPSIGESWESNYYGIGPNNRMLEKHDIFYATNSQDQQRLSSYTITESTDGTTAWIDFYHKTNNFYFYKPYSNNVWFSMQPMRLQMLVGDGSLDNITFDIDTLVNTFTIHNQGIGSINTLNFEGFTTVNFGNPSTVAGLNISATKTESFTFYNSSHNTIYLGASYQQGVGYDQTKLTMHSNDGNYIMHKLITYSGGLYPTYSVEVGGGAVDMLYSGFTNLKILMPVAFANANPDPSAQVDIPSTTKGFLPPRMTKTQRNAISSPSPGLIVIVIGETGGEYQSIYNANQTRWEKVSTTAD